jgi:hypothetical protein
MPTSEQMERVTGKIKGLFEEYSFRRIDEAHVALAPHGRGTDDGFFFWSELTEVHRRDVLANAVDWEGFNAGEKADVIGRVLDGENSPDWMTGIKYYNPNEDFARPLTARQHAAYLADIAASYGMTMEEMDDYYARMENMESLDDDRDGSMAAGTVRIPSPGEIARDRGEDGPSADNDPEQSNGYSTERGRGR